MDQMFDKGAFRQKTGIIKENVQMKFYHDDEIGMPMDAVDNYLLDRYNIVLNEKQEEDMTDSMMSPGANTAEKKQNGGYKFTQHTSEGAEAKILDNPVYQKMQFYPFRNQLIWKEKEEQQKQGALDKKQELKYREVRDNYKNILTEQVQLFMKKEDGGQFQRNTERQ